MKFYSWAFVTLMFMVVSCTSDEKSEVTKSGIEVNYIVKGEGPKPSAGDIVSIHMQYLDADGDELFSTASLGSTVPIPYDTARWAQGGLLYEVLMLITVGDSMSFEVPAGDLFTNTFRTPRPDSIAEDSKIKFVVGVESSMSQGEYVSQKSAAQNAIDGEILDTFLSENSIEAQTTPSGLRYVITQEGTGENATAGNKVTVHYNGTLLDGTKFDSSYDRGQPFSFVLGQGRVIQGWDEGIALLSKGAKATLYIPSAMAYGERGSGGVIGPNAILKFDVELIDIENL